MCIGKNVRDQKFFLEIFSSCCVFIFLLGGCSSSNNAEPADISASEERVEIYNLGDVAIFKNSKKDYKNDDPLEELRNMQIAERMYNWQECKKLRLDPRDMGCVDPRDPVMPRSLIGNREKIYNSPDVMDPKYHDKHTNPYSTHPARTIKDFERDFERWSRSSSNKRELERWSRSDGNI